MYAKMESVATRGATGNVACATKQNGKVVDLGDLEVKPAYHLRGQVVLSDGKPIADGMRVTISSEKAFDSQTATLPGSGSFEFVGLAADNYSIFASVKGYSPPPMAPVSVKDKERIIRARRGPREMFRRAISIEVEIHPICCIRQIKTISCYVN